ncbi:MAG: hypothetical protein IKY70_01800 [Bacteroidales bacterium]|nr:hypothetical protein [Bacteroidales bacterium]
MKRICLILLGVLSVIAVNAQNPTTYFMEGSQFRMQWNPAFAPDRGYLNIPLVGNMQTHITGNISLDELVFAQDGELYSIFNGAVPATTALAGLEDMNKLGTEFNYGYVGFGFYTGKEKKNFLSVDISTKVKGATELPYSLFDFMKNGNSANIAGMRLGLDIYSEVSLSYSFPLLEKLYLGVRGKLIMGMTRMEVVFDKFDAVMGEDKWYADVVGKMRIAGLQLPVEYNDRGEAVYSFEEEFGIKVPAGYGVGLDLGVTYDVMENLQLSASINDIGFMSWSKSATSVGQVDRIIAFEGVKVDESGNTTSPELDLDEIEFKVVESDSKATSLFTSFNVGGEYDFLDNRIGVGLFYTGKLATYKFYHNVTASANFRPLKWLHLSGSYSFLNNKASAVGLALNICPGFINLFAATDILLSKKTPQWVPIEQSNMNFSFGLGVPIGKRGERK